MDFNCILLTIITIIFIYILFVIPLTCISLYNCYSMYDCYKDLPAYFKFPFLMTECLFGVFKFLYRVQAYGLAGRFKCDI